MIMEIVNENKESEEAYVTIYGTRKTFIERWPTTTRVKFGCGPVKWSSTSCTIVNTFFIELVILPCTWIPVEYSYG